MISDRKTFISQWNRKWVICGPFWRKRARVGNSVRNWQNSPNDSYCESRRKCIKQNSNCWSVETCPPRKRCCWPDPWPLRMWAYRDRVMLAQAMECLGHRQLETARKAPCAAALRGAWPSAPRFWTSSFQYHVRMRLLLEAAQPVVFCHDTLENK